MIHTTQHTRFHPPNTRLLATLCRAAAAAAAAAAAPHTLEAAPDAAAPAAAAAAAAAMGVALPPRRRRRPGAPPWWGQAPVALRLGQRDAMGCAGQAPAAARSRRACAAPPGGCEGLPAATGGSPTGGAAGWRAACSGREGSTRRWGGPATRRRAGGVMSTMGGMSQRGTPPALAPAARPTRPRTPHSPPPFRKRQRVLPSAARRQQVQWLEPRCDGRVCGAEGCRRAGWQGRQAGRQAGRELALHCADRPGGGGSSTQHTQRRDRPLQPRLTQHDAHASLPAARKRPLSNAGNSQASLLIRAYVRLSCRRNS